MITITCKDFLELHDGGVACVSIHQLPYDEKKHAYKRTYFEECSQEEILNSNSFKKIADKNVNKFNVIGGGMYKVELCVYLE